LLTLFIDAQDFANLGSTGQLCLLIKIKYPLTINKKPANKNITPLLCASQVIAGKLADKEANVAPIPRVTKIIGNAQQKTVDKEVNKLRKGKKTGFNFFIILIY